MIQIWTQTSGKNEAKNRSFRIKLLQKWGKIIEKGRFQPTCGVLGTQALVKIYNNSYKRSSLKWLKIFGKIFRPMPLRPLTQKSKPGTCVLHVSRKSRNGQKKKKSKHTKVIATNSNVMIFYKLHGHFILWSSKTYYSSTPAPLVYYYYYYGQSRRRQSRPSTFSTLAPSSTL